ncbi:White colony protein WHS11 [Candida parapsilosis]|nr:White colony protein WHS11 [Candida parapsilosis]KAI5910525.1 White colony protein WHS11 [Candida parapsilosis]
MSDLGRKDLGDKVESKVKPDSQKSTFEQAKDKVTDAVDSLAGKGTSENDKSATQSASDAVFEFRVVLFGPAHI